MLVTLEARTWRTIGEVLASQWHLPYSREGHGNWHMFMSLTNNNHGGHDVLTEAKD
jgi:hypothetical protein